MAQDAGFVSAAAKTVSSFLENIFKDTRAVRKAAQSAQKKIKRTVAKFATKAQASAGIARLMLSFQLTYHCAAVWFLKVIVRESWL